MPYPIETFHLTKEFSQNKRFRDLVCSPFTKKTITAIKDVTLHVPKGEVFCLLGPNGAGKTTLIKILCTLILPTQGTGVVNGHDVTGAPKDVRKTIGYVISDERSFYWRLNAYQNLRFFGILNNIPASHLDQRIGWALSLVGLEKKAETLFKDFSQGMKQKMAIARAFLTEPDIFFMDEPTHGLDPTSAHSLRRFISEDIVGRLGKTVFLATHNLKEVEEIGGRIAIIHEGEIKACGAPSELGRDNEGMDRYRIGLKGIFEEFLVRLGRQLKGRASVKTLVEKGEEKELEIILDKKTGLEIYEVIALIAKLGGRIESCQRQQISLYDIYSKYTKDTPGQAEMHFAQ